MYLLDTDILSNLVRRAPPLPALPSAAPAPRRYGEVRAELERRGTPIGDADLRIASIALDRDLTVVTGNVRHFEKVPGLPVENWLEGREEVCLTLPSLHR